MTRTLRLELSQFPKTPGSLLDPTTRLPVSSVSMPVKGVLHHYFLAKYGAGILDRGIYEYEQCLTKGPDWRFLGTGIGADKEAKRNSSNELAKGVVRWFLHEHLGFTYFCPLEDLLGKTNPDGSGWKRVERGNVADYVCGASKADVNVLEVKGRYHSVGFNTKEFGTFREQLQRARLHDSNSQALGVKGFIGVAHWATEAREKTYTKLRVEDPVTEGQPSGSDGYPRDVGLAMVAGHYVPVLNLLGLSAHAAAIRDRSPLAGMTNDEVLRWRCTRGPLAGRVFVGHKVPPLQLPGLSPSVLVRFWELMTRDWPPYLLPESTFFGLEDAVFQRVLVVVRNGLAAASEIEPVGVPERRASSSMLRDGSVIGPADYFEHLDALEL